MTGSRLFFLVAVALALSLTGLLVGGAFRTRANVMPEDAAAGMALWRANGCEGCHTIYGQGGAFAPDLTHILDLRGEDYLREFMINPGAFHPGQRVMPRLNLTRDEVTKLLAFFRYNSGEVEAWFSNMQVSGMGGLSVSFVPESAVQSGGADPAVARGRQLFGANCASCHSLDEGVVQTGPSLWGIADRAWHRVPGMSPEQYIRESVLNPGDYIVEGFADVMAKNLGEKLSSTDLDSLIAYLMTLEEKQQ
jgi:nitric oxide reductase subunit C